MPARAAHFAGVFQVGGLRAGWIPKEGPPGARFALRLVLRGSTDKEDSMNRAGDTVRLARSDSIEAVERAEADLCGRRLPGGRSAVRTKPFITHAGHHRGPGGGEVFRSSQNAAPTIQFSFDRSWPSPATPRLTCSMRLVRIAGIARKGGDIWATAGTELQFRRTPGWALVRKLLQAPMA